MWSPRQASFWGLGGRVEKQVQGLWQESWVTKRQRAKLQPCQCSQLSRSFFAYSSLKGRGESAEGLEACSKEIEVGNVITMLFWQLLQCERRIVIQGTENKLLSGNYSGPFHPSFTHEVLHHEVTSDEKLGDTTTYTVWDHLNVSSVQTTKDVSLPPLHILTI